MSKAPTAKSVKVLKEVKDLFDKLPTARSAAIKYSIVSLHSNPHLMVQALEQRLRQGPTSGQMERVSYYVDPSIEEMVEHLAQLSRLSGEEVVRLAMEAYVNHP